MKRILLLYLTISHVNTVYGHFSQRWPRRERGVKLHPRVTLNADMTCASSLAGFARRYEMINLCSVRFRHGARRRTALHALVAAPRVAAGVASRVRL